VCSSPYKAEIHLETQKLGRGIKRETLGKHFRICLGGVTPEVLAQQIADASKEAQSVAELDFAVMVQKRATEMLAAGELRVTAQHGLTAQALLDRRAEKQADRNIALNIARLLSGAMMMPPATVIDGRVISDEPLELTDGLAPDGVYEAVG
jgi:hypothetical protein